MSLEWMKTECGGDEADCCYDVSHPIEAHHHIGIRHQREEEPKNFDLAVECDGSPECTWERSLGTLYVTHTPAGYWDDEPNEWMRADLMGGDGNE